MIVAIYGTSQLIFTIEASKPSLNKVVTVDFLLFSFVPFPFQASGQFVGTPFDSLRCSFDLLILDHMRVWPVFVLGRVATSHLEL